MSEILIFVAIALALSMALSKDPFAPCAIYSYICVMSMISLYITSVLHIRPGFMALYWQVKGDYDQVAPRVFLLLFALVAGCFVINCIAEQQSPVVSISRIGGFRGLMQRLAGFRPPKQLMRYLGSGTVVLGLLVILMGEALHFLSLDWKYILHYKIYLAARDPGEVDVDEFLLSYVHLLLPTLGGFLAVLLGLYIRQRYVFLSTLVGIEFLYAFLISIAFDSRFAAVQLVAMAGTLFVSRRSRAFGSLLGPAIPLVLSLQVYAATMTLRWGGERWGESSMNDFGLKPFAANFFSTSFFDPKLADFTLINVFGGGFVIADAWLYPKFQYPLRYKVLSFSPLPSILDTYGSVEKYSKLNRTKPPAPFSNFVEAYEFGLPYMVFFYGFLILFFYVASRFWKSRVDLTAFLVLLPAYFACLKMFAYGLRHTMRFFYLSLFLALFIAYRERAARRRTAFLGQRVAGPVVVRNVRFKGEPNGRSGAIIAGPFHNR